MKPCVYILASRRNGRLYIGMTTDIRQRLESHRAGAVRHTNAYRIKRLVHLEWHGTIEQALIRERRFKEWRRVWKIDLIEGGNPCWNDLARRLNEID